MSNDIAKEPARPWLRKLAIVAAALVVLLVAVYIIVSSSAFFKSVILPKVEQATGADIEIDHASISPFSSVVFRKVNVKTTGSAPLLQADQVTVRYGLMDIMRGNMRVNEVTIENPVIQIITEADGSSNLDPLLSKGGSDREEGARSEESGQLDLNNVQLKNATLRTITKRDKGPEDTRELKNLNLQLNKVAPGQSGKLTFSSDFQVSQHAPAGNGWTNGLLAGKAAGDFDYKFDSALRPQTAQGRATLDLGQATGTFQQVSGLRGALDCELTPSDLRQLALRFERGGKPLGQIRAQGPLDLANKEGRIKLEVLSIDREVLNVFGAASGRDFAKTTLNATNILELSQKGSFVAANGKVAIRQFTIEQAGQTTPSVDLDVDYQTTVNLKDENAVVQRLNIAGRQDNQELLRSALDRPMTLSWSSTAKGFKESSLLLTLTNLNLAQWKALLGTNSPAGVANAHLKLSAQRDGRLLQAELGAQVRDLAMQLLSNRLDQANLEFQLNGIVEELKNVTVTSYKFGLLRREQSLASGNGSLRYGLDSGELSGQTTFELSLPNLLQVAPVTNLTARAGTVKANAVYSKTKEVMKSNGTINLDTFTGQYASYQFDNFQTAFDFNVEEKEKTLKIHRAALTFRQGYDAGGSVDLTGQLNLTNQSASFEFKTVDLNQNTFRPFLAPSLGDKKLVSISLNASGAASRPSTNDLALKGEFNISNWRVTDPAKTFPETPLSVQLRVDTTKRGDTLDLKELLLKLTETKRASNELLVKGTVHLQKTNAPASQVAIQSAGLDLTSYYDLFAGKTNQPAASPTPGAPPASAPPAAKPSEPSALQATADLKIDKLFLREVAISNWVAILKLDKGAIRLSPCSFGLNGAPVQMSLASSSGGLPAYDISLDAKEIPVEPLANSFMDPASRGRYKGALIAKADIKGASASGGVMKSNLAGNASLSVTNLNLEIIGPKLRRLIEPVALILRLPELTQTPINWINARTEMGAGVVNLRQMTVFSEAFQADLAGQIPLAEVLTNSPLNLPVDVAIRRSLAEKSRIVPPNTPTNAAYVKMPQFVKLSGTLGSPDTDLNKAALSGLLLQGIGAIPGVGDKASGILQGAGQILSGQGGANTTATNSPLNIIRGVGDLFNRRQATNPPPAQGAATNQPAATNKPPRFNPFDLLPKK